MNRLTWVRDHIKLAIGKKYKGELDSELDIPTLCIKEVKRPSESTCTLS